MKRAYPVIFTFTHDEKDTVMAEIPDLKVRVQVPGLLSANANADTFISTVDIDFDPEEPAVAYDVARKKGQGDYTLEDYYRLPDDRRVELIDGVIYDMGAPTFNHQTIGGKMYILINDSIRTKGGKCIPVLSPVDVCLDCDDKTMVQPDLIIICDKDKIRRWGIMGAPEFVLEVLSDSTRSKDCSKKLDKYTDAGVKEYWIIDPKKKQLIVYDYINGDFPVHYDLDQKVGVALYNGELVIDLKEIADLIQEWPE